MPRPGVPDPYRRQAREAGYVSRAVFKLQAIDAKYQLVRRGQRVLDLGCSPGSWLQYLGERVGPEGLVVGVDLQPPAVPLTPPLYFLAGDVQSLDLAALRELAPVFDLVVSDLAPATSGIREVDESRSLALARAALAAARELLRPGGHFLVKVFEGPDLPELVAEIRRSFAACHRVKPPGSRPASRELYLLGPQKRGAPPPDQNPGRHG
jgi:23S rRNA (uridine2552-2'-O)-methyltransferase